jgi:hypothetical protein
MVLGDGKRKEEQERILLEIIEGCKKKLLNRLENIPDDWDGFELRWWTAKIFDDNANCRPQINGRRRFRDYLNTIITKNLY